jgi:hypothetical protein
MSLGRQLSLTVVHNEGCAFASHCFSLDAAHLVESCKGRAQDQYFYSTAKVMHAGSLRYVSGIDRYNASKREWHALRMAGHAKKRDAIQRAERLRDEHA